MVCSYFGMYFSIENIRSVASFEKTGVSMLGLQHAAKSLGLNAEGLMLSYGYLLEKLAEGPVIVHWNNDHFVVLYAHKSEKFVIADPSRGLSEITEKELRYRAFFKSEDGEVCQILTCSPTETFFEKKTDILEGPPSFVSIIGSLRKFKTYFILVFWAMLLGLFTQFLTPFFTKAIVDDGILSDDLGFVGYMIAGQFVLILSSTIFTILRSWVSIHLSTRISLSLVSEFLRKMFQLPMSFFETRKTGDILQRIGDQSRIEYFLTRTSLSIVFSLLTIFVYSSILCYYNTQFFILFLSGSILYGGWNLLFLKKRRKIDWNRFEYSAKSQSQLIQMINGMHDLKVYGAQEQYFEDWKKNQVNYYRNNFESLKISQYQETGAELIFQIFQICLTYLSAKLVISGGLSLGEMLSIQFIIGQLVSPVEQIIGAVSFAQDAKISYGRLFEIWKVKDEEIRPIKDPNASEPQNIEFSNVTFGYPGQEEDPALKNLDLTIEKGKVTAIVGLSGSGKTSILKLLLGYSNLYSGTITIGNTDLREMDINYWRAQCGVVLQESYVFSHSIAQNICMTEHCDYDKLMLALHIANLQEYVKSLPLKEATVIGNEGKGLSFGQRQRVLIARAIYRSPKFIFLDEATNSLDAENEAIIISNLKSVFQNRTVLLVAHRLSTVQSADKIIVLENGNILEEGTHAKLIEKRGRYFEMMQKQMNEELI